MSYPYPIDWNSSHTQDIILIDQIPNFAKLNWMHSCFCVIANRWTLSSRMDSLTGRAVEKINDEFAVRLQLFYKVPLMDYNSSMLIGLFLGAVAICTKADNVF